MLFSPRELVGRSLYSTSAEAQGRFQRLESIRILVFSLKDFLFYLVSISL